MATELDDFFAKKGKKKKSKSSSSKKGSETEGKRVKEDIIQVTTEEDTEWKEVESLVEISTDDLKLRTLDSEQPSSNSQNLNTQNKTEDSKKVKDQETSKSGVASPWQQLPVEKEPTSPTTVVTGLQNVSRGAYIPPSRRKDQHSYQPPDITSQVAFPSLQPTAINKSDNSSVPKHDDDTEPRLYTELHLQNKFASLRTEQD